MQGCGLHGRRVLAAGRADERRDRLQVGPGLKVAVDGGALAYEERGAGDAPVLLIHGIACDRRYLAPQMAHLSARRRAVALDLLGHGESDAPQAAYSIQGYARDVAQVCDALGLDAPVLVGHSLGGLVALQAAAAVEAAGVVVLDSALLVPGGREQRMRELFERLRSDDYEDAIVSYFDAFFPAGDRSAVREWVLGEVVRAPRHAVISAWENGVFGFDAEAALRGCPAPVLYVDGGTPNADLVRARDLHRDFRVERVAGGHFVALEAPDAVNGAIDRFIAG